jgi:hypothetical protein
MADTMQSTDKGLVLSITFGVVALVATLATMGTSYLYALDGDAQMRLYSGIAFAVAMGAGGLAVAALHLYE